MISTHHLFQLSYCFPLWLWHSFSYYHHDPSISIAASCDFMSPVHKVALGPIHPPNLPSYSDTSVKAQRGIQPDTITSTKRRTSPCLNKDAADGNNFDLQGGSRQLLSQINELGNIILSSNLRPLYHTQTRNKPPTILLPPPTIASR